MLPIYGNTSLNTDEYGALFSPYSVVFYAVIFFPLECNFSRMCIWKNFLFRAVSYTGKEK